jgi:hypothetical protein
MQSCENDSCDEYSWQRARDLLVQVATHGENIGYEVPCLIVAAKDDLDQSSQALQESTRVSLLCICQLVIDISSLKCLLLIPTYKCDVFSCDYLILLLPIFL